MTFNDLLSFLFLLGTFIFILFTFVVGFGAPFLPTLKRQVPKALELLDLKPGQTLLELGCGDGRVLIAAAQVGINSIGYELNPILALIAWLRTRKYKGHVIVVWGNYWKKKWPKTDGIFVFLLDPYMEKLNNKIIQDCKSSVKLVSFAFKIPSLKIDRELDGLYLYSYNKNK